MKMKFNILIITLLICLSACRTVRMETQTEVREQIVEILRDTTITLPADSAWLKALLECDSVGQIRIKELIDYKAGKNVTIPKPVIKNNIIYVQSEIDSTNIYLQLKDRYSNKTEIKNEVRTIEVYKMRAFQKVFFWIGLAVTLGLIAFITIILIKKFK